MDDKTIWIEDSSEPEHGDKVWATFAYPPDYWHEDVEYLFTKNGTHYVWYMGDVVKAMRISLTNPHTPEQVEEEPWSPLDDFNQMSERPLYELQDHSVSQLLDMFVAKIRDEKWFLEKEA